MVHGFGKMEHLGKFNLGKTMDKMRWNIEKLNIGWMQAKQNGNSKTYESNQDNGWNEDIESERILKTWIDGGWNEGKEAMTQENWNPWRMILIHPGNRIPGK